MNKKIKIILIALLVVLLGFAIIKLNKTKYFIEEPYKHENYISDRLKEPLYDTILYYSLKEQGISKEIIQVQELLKEDIDNEVSNTNKNTKGVVTLHNNRIVIFLVKGMSRSEALEFIPHEVIHIKQIINKEYINIDSNNVIYKGKKYNLQEIPYEQRPWEMHAFTQGKELQYKLKKYYK